jgi:hypothetical protein
MSRPRKAADAIADVLAKMPTEYAECRGDRHPYVVIRVAENRGVYTVVRRCPNCETTVTAMINASTGQYLDRPARTGTRPDYAIRGFGQEATSRARGAGRLALVRQWQERLH